MRTSVAPTDFVEVTNDATTRESGADSLQLDLNLKEDNVVYLYSAAEPEDWSAYREISLWWCGDNTGRISVDILTPDWNN